MCKPKKSLFGVKKFPKRLVWKICYVCSRFWILSSKGGSLGLFSSTLGKEDFIIVYVDDIVRTRDDV